MPTPEDKAREKIDLALESAGWKVQDTKAANLNAGRGVALRNFPLGSGHGFADYLLYIDGKAAGVVEAKREGFPLVGVEVQAAKYSEGLPPTLPAYLRPLPFLYQSTGIETRFTNGLDPEPRSRGVFAFHQPATLAVWLDQAGLNEQPAQHLKAALREPPYRKLNTLRSLLRQLPPLKTEGLWPAQVTAIANLETSLAQDRPRALIQMATGSGKTFTAINFIYRLVKFGGARRVLFLVDRGNLGDQTLKEFQQYVSPYNNFKFTEEFIVQRLTNNKFDTTARVCIGTIQRLYSMLKGKELAEEDEEASVSGLELLFKKPDPIEYNPAIPIETFDVIVTDECHRSIYNLWAQVLEYFDAYLIGLTATPNKQTFGFFNQNLVMEYNHEQAVADGVNVNYDVYRIRTAITQAGSMVDSGFYVEKRDRESRATRWEQLDDDFAYDPDQLDRDVVAPDQIRTIIKTFKDKLFTEIFPGRTWVPKTLIFAKDDSHAEDIVKIVREEFGKGNDFAQKITYRTTGADPKELIKAFRVSPLPRIAVTVDMIATGTDIKPVEIVLFMRAVKSRTFFEQMKGRGVRVIKADDLKSVTPDAPSKDHFVIVDAVGVCEQDKTDARPMEKKPRVSFDKLLQAVALGNTEEDVLTSIAGRLARMEHRITKQDDQAIVQVSGGLTIRDLARRIVESLDPDKYPPSPLAGEGRGEGGSKRARQEAAKPFQDPKLRELLIDIKKKNELVIDHVSQDQVIEAGFSAEALARARTIVQSFEQFIKQHKDEITALQVLYSKPYKQRLTFENIKELADAIEKPPYLWNESQLWQAYAALEKSKVKGASGKRILTDLVSLVRFAIHQDNELVPFPERVNANFNAWLAQQQSIPSPLMGEGKGEGLRFTQEQIHWLEMIRDHVAANLAIGPDDFEYAPFAQEGGLGKAHRLFPEGLQPIIDALNVALVA
ncbi:type I restriction-modification enzyme R subunit C-terminal domain-containing protein [Nitrospira moscoviensis]|uniref:Type III restriction protein res subunit n=1 Tax=Nitrospira moscoviensis TaxID=42253 RepID=A0A0K2GBH7_NITMO|nr:type I restriction-modification enzyme R subunit C-terminal domain-containing protein [Nitrospira moscoviensis]ALA58303.1 Type III restriction protein res subunit [Nitrospira moscoviensis]